MSDEQLSRYVVETIWRAEQLYLHGAVTGEVIAAMRRAQMAARELDQRLRHRPQRLFD
jgi:nitroimidazol reductase NimA-like FMN-containing flavoprotein (pyridoxamine 5'-phosphate oxidase superfamily)